ncbi:FGGY-family carbohydrate kinase [Arthrobacter castelli]|uniref:FGGY-family carbohydrate kinase n=1 Tax=Arthrobacter castelli TaxID=271431 RepID=UPI00040D37FA|nr:FGGY-family carbohydrate kinase [Arthrobacter castelli]
MTDVVLGVDIGTSSSKGVLVDVAGNVLASETREHHVDRPHPGWVEMDGGIWWDEFAAISRALVHDGDNVTAVGVSGMGPCVLLTDDGGRPLRPAILYGVDTRATVEIAELTERFGGDEAIINRCGSALSTQAVGPKLAWMDAHEPDVMARARRLFMPSSWLVHRLTGSYVLDHHSASQSTPLYDTEALDWYEPWAGDIAPHLDLPPLVWPTDIAGTVTAEAAKETGLPEGIPVVAGTIDAWSEAVSVDAQNPGDLMLMYGTTMFLVHTVEQRVSTPNLWGTIGALEGTRSLAGGMATSGGITGWLKELFGSPDYPQLLSESDQSGPGARGLLMLPYFAGERTPIADPDARGVVAGLTLSHGRGDIYRAALEATALGVRHNIESMEAAGGSIERIVAVGGGTQGELWTQIVSDVTGREQLVPAKTIGASYGAAYLAGRSAGAPTGSGVDIAAWNPPSHTVTPNLGLRQDYDELYDLYRQLYPSTQAVQHALADRQHRLSNATDTRSNA